MSSHEPMFYFCYGYINPGKNKFASYTRVIRPNICKIATILMSENFQKHLLKWWYFKCFYEQNLTVTNSPKLRGLPIFITRCAYFPSYPTKCISCFMLRHLMTPRNLRSKILKFNYLKKKKSFWGQTKSIFLGFKSAFF